MALVEILLPKMGESVMEATINTWLKKEGDNVDEEEPLLEVSTDKVDTEIPSSYTGVLKEILASEGDVVQVGSAIAVINTASDEGVSTSEEIKESPNSFPNGKPDKKKNPTIGIDKKTTANGSEKTKKASEQTLEKVGEELPSRSEKSDRFYSPLVRNIAKEENISFDELEQIEGTGKAGRVTKNDILNYIKEKDSPGIKEVPGTGRVTKKTDTAVPEPVAVSSSIGAQDEIIEMDRMRKIIAERMVSSVQISAHVQSFIEADVTNIVRWREAKKDEFFKKSGEKLTFTPLFLEAIIKTLKDYPLVNSSVEGHKIIKKKDINIGLAVALSTGNLIVPVIKNADQLSLIGLSKKVNDLAKRARENALMPDELTGGTYSVSNVGVFGSSMGTPIIVQPQVAIMALGSIQKKPAVIETPEGDMIGIRHKMFLSHSYDHRIIDGMLGSLFAKQVKEYLEAFDPNRSV